MESNPFFHETLCDVLNEVSSGKQLENHDCFLVMGDLIQVTLTSMLTNYESERQIQLENNEESKQQQHNENDENASSGSSAFFDYKLLYTILESSQNIFTLIS